MKIDHDIALAPLSSLGVGGSAETLITVENLSELPEILEEYQHTKLWFLGYGTNSLISDKGLHGTTLLMRSQTITYVDGLLMADAGVWWDDLVIAAINRDLWGLELMSAIPGGVGAAVVGNIAAYGQAIANTLAWIECLDTASGETQRIAGDQLAFDYRYSRLQEQEYTHLLITKAAFTLSKWPTTEMTYQTAIDIASEKHLDIRSLQGRRDTILAARHAARSLWDYRDESHDSRTAGSFFRNPLVSAEQAQKLISFDETGRTAEQISRMNQIHGGSSFRVSSAHVLLAAGFHRGQQWGFVRLHPDHILKLEALDGATAKDIYDVVQHIVSTVKTTLDIDIHPEVRILGDF